MSLGGIAHTQIMEGAFGISRQESWGLGPLDTDIGAIIEPGTAGAAAAAAAASAGGVGGVGGVTTPREIREAPIQDLAMVAASAAKSPTHASASSNPFAPGGDAPAEQRALQAGADGAKWQRSGAVAQYGAGAGGGGGAAWPEPDLAMLHGASAAALAAAAAPPPDVLWRGSDALGAASLASFVLVEAMRWHLPPS